MPASKSSKKKSPATRSGTAGKGGSRTKAAASKKPAAKKTVASKSTAKKAAVKKAPAKKTPAKKAPVKKAPARKAPAKKAPAKKAPAKKTAAKKAVAPKPAAKKKLPAKKPAATKPVAKQAVAKKAPAKPAIPAKKKLLPAKKPLAIKPEQPEPTFAFSGPLKAFKPYQPGPKEEYMSEGMRGHFRQILLAWQQELMEEVDRTVHHMKDEAANFPDPNDRATQESEFGLELRTRDRERKLLKKIEQALGRIEDGTYGFCSETGEEIGLRRLEARPVATLTVEAQERRELAEKQYRDRDDR
jgi:DnaK suppressor protein